MRARVLIWIGSAALIASNALAADPVSVRDLTRLVKLSDPRISPDGKSVLAVEQRADLTVDEYRTEIALVDVASRSQRPLTRDRHHAGSPRWSPSGDRVAFTAPDQARHLQLFVLPMAGGDAQQITHSKDGVDQFAWSPDGTRFAVALTDSAPERKGEDKFRNGFAVGNDDFTLNEKPRSSHVWIVDAGGGEPRRLTSGTWPLPVSLPPGPPSSPLEWTPDGKSILIVRQETPSTGDGLQTRIEVLDVASGHIRDLTGATTLEGFPLVSPDGTEIAYWRNRDVKPWQFQDVWLAPTGGGAGRDITVALDKNVYGTWWMPEGHSLLIGASIGTTVGLWLQPLDGTARRLELGAIMPTNGFWIDADVGRQGQIALIGQTKTDPYELYIIQRPDAPPERLTSNNMLFASRSLGRSETVTWPGPNAAMLDGVLTYPPGYVAGHPRPLVLVIHGGPNATSRDSFHLLSQLLASHGWLVFEPNYRGSDGSGNAFFASIYQDAGEGPGEDVMSGVKALQDRGLADRAHMAVSGWSYGGFMTSWLLGHYPFWRAAVAGAALTDWVDMYDLSDGNVTTRYEVGGSPWLGAGIDAYQDQSPDTYFSHIRTPTLVLSDTGDFRVPATQSFRLFRALRDNGVETAFYEYPVGGHFPSDPVRQMDIYQRWVDWIAVHLGE